MPQLSPGGVAPTQRSINRHSSLGRDCNRDCSLSRDCSSAHISVTTSSELAAVFAFALAFGAFSALATSVFHSPSVRFVSCLTVLSKTTPPPS